MATAACQIPIHAKGQITCSIHRGKPLDFYCEKCQDPVCPKCLSSVHKSHTVCELSEITPQKKEHIKNFIDRIERYDLVQIKIKLTSADTLLRDNSSSFDKLSRELEIQTEKLKQKLDNLKGDTLSLYQKMKTDNAKLIEKYKTDLETHERQLKQKQQQCKGALQQGVHIQIYNESCEIDSVPSLPVRPVLTTATFTPNNSYHGLLEDAFGKATTASEGQTPATRKTLLADTKVLDHQLMVTNADDICPTIDGQMSIREGSVLTLKDKTGQQIQRIVHTVDIIDICISPTSHRLWICDVENNIMKLESERLPRRMFTQLTNKLKSKEEPERDGETKHFTQKFRTKDNARCMCITGSNHVIVGMTNQLSKFTTKGQEVLTTIAAGILKPVVSKPHRVAECPVTHNVAVIDSSSAGYLNKHVVVLNADFIKLFVCRNDINFLQNPETENIKYTYTRIAYLQTTSLNDIVYPEDVMYDSEGNLLIVHKKPFERQFRVLLFDGRGNFRRGIHYVAHMQRYTCINKTPSVGLDKDDTVWIACEKLLSLQYSH